MATSPGRVESENIARKQTKLVVEGQILEDLCYLFVRRGNGGRSTRFLPGDPWRACVQLCRVTHHAVKLENHDAAIFGGEVRRLQSRVSLVAAIRCFC